MMPVRFRSPAPCPPRPTTAPTRLRPCAPGPTTAPTQTRPCAPRSTRIGCRRPSSTCTGSKRASPWPCSCTWAAGSGCGRLCGDAAPCTSGELAAAAGLQERWLREWLHALAAAELVQHHQGRFALTPEAEALLADPDHPSYMPGVFGPPVSAGEIERTIEGFRTGLGMTWEEHGDSACHMQTAMNAAKYRAYLVPEVVAALDGAAERLSRGGVIIDVGCGAGVAAAVLAAGFPEAAVTGIDPSARAIDRARAEADRLGLDNLAYRQGTFDDLDRLPEADLLVTLDVLHDLPRPDRAVAAARRNLSAEGWWLVADIKSRGGARGQPQDPGSGLHVLDIAALLPVVVFVRGRGGAGLGALGLHPDRLEEMTAAAGFGRFARHDFDFDPVNWYYEIRR